VTLDVTLDVTRNSVTNMNIKNTVFILVAFIQILDAKAQGTFENLDFESADVTLYAPNSTDVPVSSALSGWNVFYGSTQTSQMCYDAISLASAEVSVIDDKAAVFAPLQGTYSAFLFGGVEFPSGLESVGISQTGLVPAGTKSLQFDGYVFGASFSVTLGGQTINMTPLEMFPQNGAIPAYALYGGNIPASFAGQAETLTFTEPPATGVQPSEFELDSISFSPSSVTVTPESSPIMLTAIGGILFALYRHFAPKRH
jgi:hypothetical protein